MPDVGERNATNIQRSFWIILVLALASRSLLKQKKAKDISPCTAVATPQAKQKKSEIKVDHEFYRKLYRVMQVVIPGWRSKESAMLVLHSAFLIFRTFLSVYIAELDGKIVSNLVCSRR